MEIKDHHGKEGEEKRQKTNSGLDFSHFIASLYASYHAYHSFCPQSWQDGQLCKCPLKSRPLLFDLARVLACVQEEATAVW